MLRNLSSLTEELAAAARPPGPAESKKNVDRVGKREERRVVETSGRRWATKTPEYKVV